MKKKKIRKLLLSTEKTGEKIELHAGVDLINTSFSKRRWKVENVSTECYSHF